MKNQPILLFFCCLFFFFSCEETTENLVALNFQTLLIDSISYQIPEQYELEVLYQPKEAKQGSWVSLAEGPEGRFYASDQWGDLYTFQIPEVGQTLDSTQVIPVDLPIGRSQGLLWAFNSLYVSVNNPWKDRDGNERTEYGSGVYRLRDTDQDNKLDDIQLLMRLEGSGEHGPHSLVLSPNQKHIYFIAGNHTKVPDALSDNSRQVKLWDEDNLLPTYLDARGHANQIKAPGGWIARMNPEGDQWELISSGYRNPYDMGFNRDGELFTFDSDMEWDIGMPWYRPIRVCHVTSGSEYGWRTGSGKWPTYYPDNLPAVVNLGQGSPTAVVMGQNLNFPAPYNEGMFVFDWSFGTIYHVALQAQGSTYDGKVSEFFSGTPLPLTDAIAGSDGALYFATGGRNLYSGLYRLRYTGPIDEEAPNTAPSIEAESRSTRKALEAYHSTPTPEGLNKIWESLDHTDRFVRYAARAGLEHYPVANWSQQFQDEEVASKIIPASIALSRKGDSSMVVVHQSKLLEVNWKKLDRNQKLDYLRAIGLLAIRTGAFPEDFRLSLIEKLGSTFPSKDLAMDRELAGLLIYLKDTKATQKCLDLLAYHTKEGTITHPSMLSNTVSSRSEQYGPVIMETLANMPPTEALFYATVLSHAEAGWDEKAYQQYFNWFYDGLNAKGGLSFKPFIENIRKTALAKVPEEKKAAYEELSGVYQPGAEMADLPQPEGPGQDYTINQLQNIAWSKLGDYKGDIEKGQLIYEAALCATCHRMRGEGGNAGPDLTQLPTRFSRGEIVMALYSPNDEISDQYAFTLFKLKDGRNIAGKIQREEEDKIVILPSPYSTSYTVELKKEEVLSQELSPVSPMPPNLLNRLNEAEITDLFAYLLAGGDPNHEYYSDKVIGDR